MSALCLTDLHDPTPREHHEPRLPVASPHDLDLHPVPGERLRQGLALVGAVGPDQLQQPAQRGHEPLQQLRSGHRVVHVGRRDGHLQEQAQRVGQNVALPAVARFRAVVAAAVAGDGVRAVH